MHTGRRRLVWSSLGVCILVAVVLTAPWVVAHTPLRNFVLNRVLAGSDLQGTAGGMSCGWFSPLQLEQLELARGDDTLRLSIDQLVLDRPWWRVWRELPRLGAARVERPRIELVIDESLSESPIRERRPSESQAALTADLLIQNASLQVRTAGATHPVIALDNLDLDLRIVPSAGGRLLEMAPVQLLDRVTLTPELCDRGLQLAAPVLARATRVEGQASLEFTSFRLPLDADRQRLAEESDIRGQMQLHQVEAGLRNPILQQAAELLAGLFSRELPSIVRVADDTAVRFEVREGRVYHEGLTFLIPELAPELVWRSRGTVGFDETLDLTLEARLPWTLVRDGPISRELASRPIEFHVGGTLDRPRLEIPRDREWLQRWGGLLADVVPEERQPLAEAVLNAVGALAGEEGELAAAALAPLLERFRERQEVRREARQADPSISDDEVEEAARRPRLLPRIFQRRVPADSDGN